MDIVTTYAFIGFLAGGIAILISLYALLVLDEIKENGRSWVELNKELKQKIEQLEKGKK